MEKVAVATKRSAQWSGAVNDRGESLGTLMIVVEVPTWDARIDSVVSKKVTTAKVHARTLQEAQSIVNRYGSVARANSFEAQWTPEAVILAPNGGL